MKNESIVFIVPFSVSSKSNTLFKKDIVKCKPLYIFTDLVPIMPVWDETFFIKLSLVQFLCNCTVVKVEKILKGSLDSIPSPSPLVKIQIMGGKVCLRCKGKTLLGVVNKLLKVKVMGSNPGYLLKSFLLYL